MDIVVSFLYEELNSACLASTIRSDVYFSSKGHDCPGFYRCCIHSGVIRRRS